MKRTISALIVLAMLSGLSGCAAAPDQNIVAQKNNERLIESAKAEPEMGAALADVAKTTQENYQFSYENKDKTLVIQADANVGLPEGDGIPMYRVTGSGFSQELVNKIYDYFFPDGGTYVTEGTDATKAHWDERILEYKQLIAQIEADETMDEQDKQSQIAELEGSLERAKALREDAPDESTLVKIPAGPEMTDQSENASGPCVGCWIFGDDADFYVLSSDYDAVVNSYLYYIKEESGASFEESGAVPVNEETEATVNQGRLSLTLEEARKYAEEFFIAIDVPVEEMAAFFVEKDEMEYDTFGNGNIKTKHYSYRFHFTRVIDGLSLATSTINEISGDETSLTWLYERIFIDVNEDGICRLQWQDPLTVTDTVSENVGVISFEEAAEIFETMVPLTYEGEIVYNSEDVKNSLDIMVDRVELTLLRVRDDGGKRTGLLTPTWTFYGTIKKHYDYLNEQETYDDQTEAPYIILAVNAVDGSVIDLVEGY